MNHPATRPRRLFVSGGSSLSANAAQLWRELGKCLAAEDGLVVITGGLQEMLETPGGQTADRTVVDGMLQGLRKQGLDPQDRIETFLPDSGLDYTKLRRFSVGREIVLENRTAQSRRFRMVHASDVVISVEGGVGTRSVLDVALAMDRPILPFPYGGGKSKDVWQEERVGICHTFQLSPAEALQIEQMELASLNPEQIREWARRSCSFLMRGFTERCFVIMPFHDDFHPVYELAIEKALAAYGLQPLRTDKHILNGNIVEAIRDGLKNSYFAIADITGERPNVMYELGIAHAHRRPVILLRKGLSEGGFSSVPFDLRTESLIRYGDDLEALRERLETAIFQLTGRKRAR